MEGTRQVTLAVAMCSSCAAYGHSSHNTFRLDWDLEGGHIRPPPPLPTVVQAEAGPYAAGLQEGVFYREQSTHHAPLNLMLMCKSNMVKFRVGGTHSAVLQARSFCPGVQAS